ncbi:hypothetical protein CFC21_049472 [Triticum aestivum]|uniref:Uncharacterized protein n=4 Tax=Triticinae TaxID=1648030 RepID=A0A9R1G3X4_WHEAT|nr:hypothetical protein CFC21_049470 [Triticum aestivum]KAF7039498.1 hypothetical protein CFC21_049471 [Triticum aestivum]KAF7039499.1 hypothetical protein CFC21_049472 [Triticum aestivum]
MEGTMKSGARGVKGKVAMVYSKYAGKAQAKPAPSVTAAHAYQPRYPSAIDATASAAYAATGDVDERATAFILSVRERFKNEQKMVI